MRISYDPEVDALYIRFVDGPIEVTTRLISEDVAINYAPDDEIVGIEILAASEHAFRGTGERRLIVENLVAVAA
jgi:uncharacterized protein YuzE